MSGKKQDKKRKKKHNIAEIWVLKITLFTFIGAVICSCISQITTSKSDIIISIMLLSFMILISIIFDGIGLSVASCSEAELEKYSRFKKQYDIARYLLKNAEKVNNICADVIGDMCGILSGACGASIVVELSLSGSGSHWATIIISSIIAAVTVGGKASLKKAAVKNSAEFVFMSARMIGIFSSKFNTKRKK
ncbi:MAG: hypothetical protein HFE33_00510 [Clostridia bacterium]|jgi:CBS domain containing-hemolysin-like protein|nr:hypothetical protein [Clostridia bacterium]MCI8944140.1 hypothetical protein [Clostridia bacterium]MCI9290180.1 hypothetical protein [Clostridia bacterium]